MNTNIYRMEDAYRVWHYKVMDYNKISAITKYEYENFFKNLETMQVSDNPNVFKDLHTHVLKVLNKKYSTYGKMLLAEIEKHMVKEKFDLI